MNKNVCFCCVVVLALVGITLCGASATEPPQSPQPLALAAVDTAPPAPETANAGSVEAITKACRAREYDKALELAKALAISHPDRTDLANVLFESAGALAQAKQYGPAAHFYQLLTDRFPKSQHIKAARTELAACYYYARQLENCLGQVKVNLKLHPDSPWVEYWRFLDAQIRYRLWKFAEAKTALKEFLADYPNGDYSEHAKAYLGRIDPPLQTDKNGIVAYSGRFEDDIRLGAAIKALPKHIDDGFRMLQKRLGVDLRPHANILYAFKDGGRKVKGGLKATTRIIGVNNKPAIIIYFYAERTVTDPEGFRKTTIHEMKHAGFLGIMGAPYHDLPQWIREGLALWGSEDVELRLQLVLCNTITGDKDPESVLDGIEDPDHDYRDYLEDVLAFEWLASKDPGNIPAFCRRLVKGEPYREIWADLSGLSYAKAMQEANAHCRRRVREALGEGYKGFAQLRKESDAVMKRGADTTRTWLAGGGKARFQKWLAGNAGHPAQPMARLSFARSFITAQQYAQGRELLKKVLAEDGCRSTLTDDAQFWIGVSYNHQRDHANARKAFGVFLRDYPSSPYAKQLFGKMQVAGPVTR